MSTAPLTMELSRQMSHKVLQTCIASSSLSRPGMAVAKACTLREPVLQTVCDDLRSLIDQLGRHGHEMCVQRAVHFLLWDSCAYTAAVAAAAAAD